MATRIAPKSLPFEQIIDKEIVSEHYTVYTVLGSKGNDYRVTAVDGKVTGCDCVARTTCYHMRGVQSYVNFEIAFDAPIAEPVDETPAPAVEPMTVAEFVFGKFGEDLGAHIQDEFCDDFAGQAQAIIDKERIREEAEAHLNEQQRRSLAKYREETANMKRLQQMAAKRESAPLQPAGHVVEETEFGFIPMRQTA